MRDEGPDLGSGADVGVRPTTKRRPTATQVSGNTVYLQGNMVGQTITLCRLPGSGRDRPRNAMVPQSEQHWGQPIPRRSLEMLLEFQILSWGRTSI